MQVITEGHKYKLAGFETEAGEQTVQFIEKESVGESLVTVNDGTTNEEVIEMLINRISFLQAKFPCKENACAITKLEEALMWLEKRTRDRVKRNVEGKAIK